MLLTYFGGMTGLIIIFLGSVKRILPLDIPYTASVYSQENLAIVANSLKSIDTIIGLAVVLISLAYGYRYRKVQGSV